MAPSRRPALVDRQAGQTIQWCTSRTKTPRLMRCGPDCRCPRRRSGRPRPAAASGSTYTWGDEPEQPGQRLANYWHGDFPWRPEPGYGRTTAVASFPPNGYGLYDMAGNVWEWTTDWYADSREGDPCCEAGSYDPQQPQFRVPRKVIKGGSFLCADSYCLRYRPGRPQAADGRHRDEPHRLPLHQTMSFQNASAHHQGLRGDHLLMTNLQGTCLVVASTFDDVAFRTYALACETSREDAGWLRITGCCTDHMDPTTLCARLTATTERQHCADGVLDPLSLGCRWERSGGCAPVWGDENRGLVRLGGWLRSAWPGLTLKRCFGDPVPPCCW